jgi:hypothetical protein
MNDGRARRGTERHTRRPRPARPRHRRRSCTPRIATLPPCQVGSVHAVGPQAVAERARAIADWDTHRCRAPVPLYAIARIHMCAIETDYHRRRR